MIAGVVVWVVACSASVSPAEPTTVIAQDSVCSGDVPACGRHSVGLLDWLFDTAGNVFLPPDQQIAEPGEIAVISACSVQGDSLSEPELVAAVDPDWASRAQTEIWARFIDLVPLEYRKDLDRFVLFTDGPHGTLASVEPILENPALWSLGVDVADAGSSQELTNTLLHELGHLLTLNHYQIATAAHMEKMSEAIGFAGQSADGCRSYEASLGCSRTDSYLNLFFQAFWSDIYGGLPEARPGDGASCSAELDAVYSLHQDRFLTKYSATSPEEDIAESFADFVLTAKPRGDSIAEQKVLFFYNFPELVALREQIIARTSSRSSRDWLR
jgi:hypothetical protein